MRFVITFFLILFNFIFQSTVFRSLSFAGIVPNLLIILTACAGFMRGEKEGLLVGLFSGLLQDVFYGSVLGFYGMIFMYIGFFNGKFRVIFYPEDIRMPIALIAASDLTYGFFCYLLLFLLRGRFDFLFYFRRVILPESVYTVIVTCVAYPIILKLNQWLERREKRRERNFV